MSISPGSSVTSPRSMTVASSGTEVGATSVIRSPSISSSPGVISSPFVDVEQAGAAQVDRRLRGAGSGHRWRSLLVGHADLLRTWR